MLVLLDRDGVVSEERGHITSPDQLVLVPGSGEAIARLNAAGHKVALVTNQSSVGQGMISEQELEHIHDTLRALLKAKGAHLDAIYWCGDAPDTPGPRRKPAPGMVLEALRDFNARAEDTPFIGDQLRDLEAAQAVGCPRYLVRTGKGAATEAEGLPHALKPVTICASLVEAVEHILQRERAR